MSGYFGVASNEDCMFDLFYGIDFHSHLGARRAGICVYDEENGFAKSIHNIENAPFRTKFASESTKMHGTLGIGCISDFEPQPMLVRSKHGTFAITTVGKINNSNELIEDIIKDNVHFFEMQNGLINQTELVAALINHKDNFIEGIKYAQEVIDGSISIIILTPKGIYAARDLCGKTPITLGKKDGSMCVSFENFAYLKLDYEEHRELAPGEIAVITADGDKTLYLPNSKMKMCTFLWVYYGYPSSSYEGINVEQMRYSCGKCLAKADKGKVNPDTVAGVPDSGMACAIGYANESGITYSRPFIKYTPTWARSFMPTHQNKRNLIAKMKLIAVRNLIEDRSLLLIDDSIVRGTQLLETTDFLYSAGAKEVHIRTACPPILFSCKYLNFSRSKSDMDLIARKVIAELEGENPDISVLRKYADPDTEEYKKMVEEIKNRLHFTSLGFLRLDDMLNSVGLDHENLCTYCWDGKE